MTVWVLEQMYGDKFEEDDIEGVYMSPEAAQSRHPADDWKRDQHNVWFSDSLKMRITKWEAKG